jgi:hypothetical protein
LYDNTKPPAENYRTPFLVSSIDTYLERQHPAHFQVVQATYDARLAEIEQALSGDKKSWQAVKSSP